MIDSLHEHYDVIVVGAGNAALCAALSAKERGASVLVLERAPEHERGGNTAFTAGAMRFTYESVQDILELVPDLTSEQIANTNFSTYPSDKFYDDMARVTDSRADPDLVELLVSQSFPTLKWMREQGVRFAPIYGRQAFSSNGKFTFWGGLTLEVVGGGLGLVEALTNAAKRAGIDILYQARAMHLITDGPRVVGIECRQNSRTITLSTGAVVLGAGGFQANAEWRARYLGENWELAKVRGTRFNTGDGIRMALEANAMPWGNWSGCHAVGWDLNAPQFGDIEVGDSFQKHSYPFGIMVNAHGERFVDEGADFRNYTYAKYGREILKQPGQFAWQIFDSKVDHLLRDEYRIRQITRVTAPTLEALAGKLEGVNSSSFLKTLSEYNQAVDDSVQFDPNRLDGRRTIGLRIPKSNWSNRLDEGPFAAYAVTCGITFTFGGVRIDPRASVVDCEGDTIPGLYACGEMVGGIFYFNYPGGSGLTGGSVFGRIAGASAARDSLTDSLT